MTTTTSVPQRMESSFTAMDHRTSGEPEIGEERKEVKKENKNGGTHTLEGEL
jgi:hypothetical protein